MQTAPKKILLIVFVILVVCFVYFFAYPYVMQSSIEENNQQTLSNISDLGPNDTLALSIGTTSIQALVADTEAEREQGLGDRPYLDDNGGMFFIFDTPDTYPFWMKDMSFPIDIAWISSDFTITDIAPNVSPSTYPNTFSPTHKALYVLEVNANFFSEHGIKVGDTVKVDKN